MMLSMIESAGWPEVEDANAQRDGEMAVR